ncbi:MAG: gamma-glutamylcyclotransferase family protein [Pseudomonadota bacterium]|nr:gamma-glutamylcyclotransferase family protein [Pseudomonadota bacterium]
MPTVFLYGTSLPGQPDHRWVLGLPTSAATVRGALWRGPRNRPMLVPDGAGKPIRGVLVEVEPDRLAVMDLVETAGDGPLVRVTVRASHNMRSVPAEAWVFPMGARPPRGWRKLATEDWAGFTR